MMQTKIEAAQTLPTLRDAANEMEAIAGDLEDINALLFALANPNGDWEFNPRALHGVMLAIDQVKARASNHVQPLICAHGATSAPHP